jgi:hypothetical protein
MINVHFQFINQIQSADRLDLHLLARVVAAAPAPFAALSPLGRSRDRLLLVEHGTVDIDGSEAELDRPQLLVVRGHVSAPRGVLGRHREGRFVVWVRNGGVLLAARGTFLVIRRVFKIGHAAHKERQHSLVGGIGLFGASPAALLLSALAPPGTTPASRGDR